MSGQKEERPAWQAKYPIASLKGRALSTLGHRVHLTQGIFLLLPKAPSSGSPPTVAALPISPSCEHPGGLSGVDVLLRQGHLKAEGQGVSDQAQLSVVSQLWA